MKTWKGGIEAKDTNSALFFSLFVYKLDSLSLWLYCSHVAVVLASAASVRLWGHRGVPNASWEATSPACFGAAPRVSSFNMPQMLHLRGVQEPSQSGAQLASFESKWIVLPTRLAFCFHTADQYRLQFPSLTNKSLRYLKSSTSNTNFVPAQSGYSPPFPRWHTNSHLRPLWWR